MKLLFWPIFFRISDHGKCQGTDYKVPEGLLTNIVQVLGFISIGPKRSLETNISQNGYLPGEKRFWPTFSRIIDGDTPQGTPYWGPQVNLTKTLEDI